MAEEERLETIPLYDQVKNDIYEAWLSLVSIHRDIMIDIAEGYEPKKLNSFKAELVAFYGMIRTKIGYTKREKYRRLHDLKKYVRKPQDMNETEMEEFFLLFCDLIEALGITKIGKPSFEKPETAPFEPNY